MLVFMLQLPFFSVVSLLDRELLDGSDGNSASEKRKRALQVIKDTLNDISTVFILFSVHVFPIIPLFFHVLVNFDFFFFCLFLIFFHTCEQIYVVMLLHFIYFHL